MSERIDIEPTEDHGAAYRLMDAQEVTIALFYQNPLDDPDTAKANITHAAECWNALEGMNPEAIGEVIAAARRARTMLSCYINEGNEQMDTEYKQVCAALAKLKG